MTKTDTTGPDGAATGPLTVHVVPHTHWDREWYLPFETFRLRAGDVLDAVLTLLEGPDDAFPSFTLDGQAVVLDDVLAQRPELAPRVRDQVAAGRLRIGPWYVLADEFLTSPEALVRNLELGLRACRRHGAAMTVAYTPDSFGHVAHLPTLVAGFGLDGVVFQRGVGDEGEALGSDFWWESPDGTARVFATHLVATYSAGAALGHQDWAYRDPLDPERVRARIGAILYGEDGDGVGEAWLRTALERLGGMERYRSTSHVLLLNGTDHLYPQASLPEALHHARDAFPEVTFVHGDVGGYVTAARDELVSAGDGATHRGEFRSSRYHHVLSGVWSTRMPLKLRNHAVETRLERVAGPLLARSLAAGGPDDRPAWDHAWTTLLQNHPHDSICGCSVDEVANDMGPRFDAAETIANRIAARAARSLAPEHGEGTWLAFDPGPRGGWSTVAFDATVPAGHGHALRVVDADGAPCPTQVEVRRRPAPGRRDAEVDVASVRVAARLTPLGITPLHVVTGDARDAQDEGATRSAARPELVSVDHDGRTAIMRNAALEVAIAGDGSIDLRDRATDRVVHATLWLVDEADAGDSYDADPVAGNEARVIVRPSATPRVTAHGPVRATVAASCRLDRPARLGDDRVTPVGTGAVSARVDLHLDAFSEALILDVDLDNTAEDHRLRLEVRTDLSTDTLVRDAAWSSQRVPVDPPAGADWYQTPVPEHPIRRFAAIEDAQRGLALLTRGLPEVVARQSPEGTALAVTLLRSIGWLSRDDLTTRPEGAGPALEIPGAQCLGRTRVQLGLAPYAAGDDVHRSRIADAFIAAPIAIPAVDDHHPDLLPTCEPALRKGGLEITEPLTLSTLVPPSGPGRAAAGDAADPSGTTEIERRLIVRVYNPTKRPVHGTLTAPTRLSGAKRVRLDETPIEPLDVRGSSVDISLAPSGVITVALVLADPC